MPREPQSVVRFGAFDFDARTGELRRSGRRVHLTPQAARLLALLVARPGELVTRDEIRTALWEDGRFVEFEPAVNACISQIRHALGDRATAPRFVETLPRHGYRFVAPVSAADTGSVSQPATAVPDQPAAVTPTAHAARAVAVRSRPTSVAFGGAIALVAVTGLLLLQVARPAPPVTVAVLPIDAPAGDRELETLGTLLQERALVELTTRAPSMRVLARPVVETLRGSGRTLDGLARTEAAYWVDATLQRIDGNRVRLHAKVARLLDWRILWAQDYEFAPDVFVTRRADIASELAQRLVEACTGPTAAASSPVAEWSDLALSGELLLANGGPEALPLAIDNLERGVAADPANWQARGLLARALVRAAGAGLFERRMTLARAEREAALVLRRNPHNRDALAALGGLQLMATGSRWEEAGRTLARAVSVPVPVVDARVYYSIWLSAAGAHDEAIAQARAVEGAYPISNAQALAARAYYMAGRFHEARMAATRILSLYPEADKDSLWSWRAAEALAPPLAHRANPSP